MAPWKYGFKNVKSIVKIEFVEKQPRTAWNIATPNEVRLLRERESGGGSPALEPGEGAVASAPRAASSRSASRRCRSTVTRIEVASLYSGMDLRKF